MSKYFKRGDILIIIIVLISAFLLYLPAFIPKNGRIAEITADGSVVNRINLSEVKESIVFARDGKLMAVVVTDKEDNEEFSQSILDEINPLLPLYSQLYKVEITHQPLMRTEKQTLKRYLYK